MPWQPGFMRNKMEMDIQASTVISEAKKEPFALDFKSYAPLLQRHGISHEYRRPWLIVGSPNFKDKWLLFLSVCQQHAFQIFDLVLPVLKAHEATFIMISDQLMHNQLNNHIFPLRYYGKAITIFCESPEQAQGLAEELARVTNDFEGLELPGTLRLGSILYAAFSRSATQEEINKLPEGDIPYVAETPTKGISFNMELAPRKKKFRRFILGRYLPVGMIISSPKGNILKGVDVFRWRWCFIKQARAWAGEDLLGREMRHRLQWQMKVSQDVDSTVNTPQMLAYAEQDGYSYLISRFVEGLSLDECIKGGHDGKYEKVLKYYEEAIRLVADLHSAGYIHRDLTAKNFLIDCKEKMYLTDFELAYPIGPTKMAPHVGGTPGYVSPEQLRMAVPTVKEDIYSMGALLYHLITGKHPKDVFNLPLDERDAILIADLEDNELLIIIKACTEKEAQKRPDILDLHSWAVNRVSNKNQK